jgi:hypothetical protein
MNSKDIPTIKDRVPNFHAKLTHEQVREIRKHIKDGVPNKVLAIDYGVCSSVISQIKKGWSYRRVL